MKSVTVEDDKDLGDMIKLYFVQAGYESDICYSGDTALFHILNTHYDILILDRMLPEIDGRKYTEQLQGTILLMDTLGGGSTFTLKVPCIIG